MRYIVLFLLINSLHAAPIETKADRTTLTSNQQLHVDVEFSSIPELFPLLYSLMGQPKSSFQIVSYEIITPTHVRFTLQPMHTGKLIFAPGVVSMDGKRWLVPAVSVECVSSGLTSLTVPALSPLYPERRIDLNPFNRLFVVNQERLLQAQKENKESLYKFRLAWNSLAYGICAIAFSLLAVWAIIYYDLLARAKRPKKTPETPLDILVKEVKDEKLPLSVRWQKLSDALREALGARALNLIELEEYVATNRDLTATEKKVLMPAVHTLGAISYAGKSSTEEEWHKVSSSILKWLRY